MSDRTDRTRRRPSAARSAVLDTGGDRRTGGRIHRNDPDAATETRTALPDGGYVEVSLSDWGAVEEHLGRFGRRGAVDIGADRIEISVGNSRVTVTREGRVETGMPLHEFAKDDVGSLRFDHEAGRLQVHGENGLVYEFRRP